MQLVSRIRQSIRSLSRQRAFSLAVIEITALGVGGIRLALGATPGGVRALIVSRGLILGALGILLTVTAAACAVPAWRASRIDPAIALREE